MRLSDINVKGNDKNAIKVLNKTKVYSQKLKNNIVTVKEKSNIKNEEGSANEYANNKIIEKQRQLISNTGNKITKYNAQTIKNTKNNLKNINKIQKNIKKKQIDKKIIKKANYTAKGTIKNTKKAIKSAEKTGKTAIKTTTKATTKTIKIAIQTAKKTYQILKLTAKATAKGIKVGAKVVSATIKTISSAIKAFIAFLVDGGWVPVVIILAICLVIFLFCCIFGVFFSDEKNENIYGIENSIGSTDIVEVATKQLGNKGGEMYWRWYGFNDRVEWCACFVSWCANECGYIEKGTIPKFAGCDTGVTFFSDRTLWQERGFTPSPRRYNIF